MQLFSNLFVLFFWMRAACRRVHLWTETNRNVSTAIVYVSYIIRGSTTQKINVTSWRWRHFDDWRWKAKHHQHHVDLFFLFKELKSISSWLDKTVNAQERADNSRDHFGALSLGLFRYHLMDDDDDDNINAGHTHTQNQGLDISIVSNSLKSSQLS